MPNNTAGRRDFMKTIGGGVALASSGCLGVEKALSPSEEDTGATPSDEGKMGADSRTIVVDAKKGSNSGIGTEDDPYETLEQGLNVAEPGDTVRAEPGEYSGPLVVRNGGEPGNPLTITGPEDAVLTGGEDGAQPMYITASHIHLTGMSVDGLLDSENPEDPLSYADAGPLIEINPPKDPDSDEYLKDLKISPHTVGNAYAHTIVVQRSKNVEIGPFRVTGLAGAYYMLDEDATEEHVGEIVYLGTPLSAYGSDHYPWEELDQTRNVHVHHIDNSDGHPHSEMVNTKPGTRDILIEYCTDGGGSQNTEEYPSASIRFQSHGATLRWCDIREGLGNGVHVSRGGADWVKDQFEGRIEEPFDPDLIGKGHIIYGNRISDFSGAEIKHEYVSPEDQIICGNEIEGEILNHHEEPYTQEICPTYLREGDGVGHLGGDSPWPG